MHRVCVTWALESRAQVEAEAVFGATVVLLGLQEWLWCALCTGCAQEALQQRWRRPRRRDRACLDRGRVPRRPSELILAYSVSL